MRRDFDVIVVGAGPSGSACALQLAREGVNTILLEKQRSPGERNTSSGIIYGGEFGSFGLRSLVPDFETTAPLERKISSHEVIVLSNPDEKKKTYRSYSLTRESLPSRFGIFNVEFETGHDYTILRSRFDRWLANLAVEAGATLSTGTTVADLLKEDGRVTGVVTSGEELHARLVVDCSGVNSTLVEIAGLRGSLVPRQLYHGIERLFRLRATKIEERFGLEAGEGKALTFLGDFMLGVGGSAFINPNLDTLSVGVVASMDSMVRATTEHFDRVGKLFDALNEFEDHPFVRELLEEAEFVGSSTHNIPKGFKSILKKPHTHGYLAAGDALGAFIKIGPMIDGIGGAIASGMMAAKTYLLAAISGSFREKNLLRYRDLLTPIYEEVNRSGRESFISESGLLHRALPRIIFGSRILSEEVKIRKTSSPARAPHRDASIVIGDEMGPALIEFKTELGSQSVTKPWVPSCPSNCFALVTPYGNFSSYRELFERNLADLGKDQRTKAITLTMRQIADGKISFDPMGCVECGTCRAIGPRGTVRFGYERGEQVSPPEVV